jgi:XXXCH domain-containing protein
MTSKKKFKNDYTSNQLSEFLRNIAAQIDGTSIENSDDEGYCFDNFMSITLKIKRRPSGYSVKIKVKTESSEFIESKKKESGTDDWDVSNGEISFKHLKKRMKSSFKLINKDLIAGRLPNRAIVESFKEDTDLMGRFPKKCGDPYPEFKKACDGLLDAVDNTDFDALGNCYAELKRLRNECHRRMS